MENQRIPPLSWPYYYQAKSIEELKHSLLCITLELETTRLAAGEEIRRKDEDVKQLKDLLTAAIRERDEANDKYQSLLLQLQQQQDENFQKKQQQQEEGQQGKRGDSNAGMSSSECEESIVSGSPPVQAACFLDVEATARPPLPEKGKLLQAVMKAGPLLQTLLLAGPLPQWRHPPPPLDTLEIPPVTIPATTLANQSCNLDNLPIIADNCNNSSSSNNSNFNKKRSLLDCHDSSPTTAKYQRIIL